MFIALLKFSDNKGKASQFMEGHKEWIKRGFDDGVFLLGWFRHICVHSWSCRHSSPSPSGRGPG